MNCKYCAVSACDGFGEDNVPERCEFFTLMTRGDRFQVMSEEELATWITSVQQDTYAYCMGETGKATKFPTDLQGWLNWLSQDVEDAEEM